MGEIDHSPPQIETLYEQDFNSLREECLQNNFLFEDPEFLPREEFLRERSKQYEDIVWLRPHDISRPDEPILVSNVRLRLPVGKYCIVPSTFLPDQEGDFILRVHIEQFGPEED